VANGKPLPTLSKGEGFTLAPSPVERVGVRSFIQKNQYICISGNGPVLFFREPGRLVKDKIKPKIGCFKLII